MSEREADPNLQTSECKANNTKRCPNKNSSETWDSETVWCNVCGLYYKLYDEDMK